MARKLVAMLAALAAILLAFGSIEAAATPLNSVEASAVQTIGGRPSHILVRRLRHSYARHAAQLGLPPVAGLCAIPGSAAARQRPASETRAPLAIPSPPETPPRN